MILPLKPKYLSYKIDGIFAEHNHNILRLPPYHLELNPIELIWAHVKNSVAQNNTTFKMDDVIKHV
jgi:transposase